MDWIHPVVFQQFYKRDKFCDSLFVFQHLKMGLLLRGELILSFESRACLEGSKNNFDSPENVSILVKGSIFLKNRHFNPKKV